jgi:hypothetical protein
MNEEPEIRAPEGDPGPEEPQPQVEIPGTDPFLEGLFPDSPAGYGIILIVVICAVLVFRKFLRRPRPKDIT